MLRCCLLGSDLILDGMYGSVRLHGLAQPARCRACCPHEIWILLALARLTPTAALRIVVLAVMPAQTARGWATA